MKSAACLWLFGIGFAALAVLLACVSKYIGNEDYRRLALIAQNNTRTYVDQYVASRHIAGDEVALMLAHLPPPPSLGAESVRFVAVPTCANTMFAFSLAADGTGRLIIVVRQQGANLHSVASRRTFSMPATVTKSLLAEFDRLAPPWQGDAEIAFDGTHVGFERAHAGTTFSGGDATSTYAHLAAAVKSLLTPYVAELAGVDHAWLHPSAGC